MIEAILDDDGLLGLCILAVLLRLRCLQQTCLLLLPSLWLVFLQEAKQLTSLILVYCHVELIERWWDLQTLEKNALHALELDVLWPPCEARHITLGLDVATKAKISWSLFKERIRFSFLALRCKWSRSHLLRTFSYCFLSHGCKSSLRK